MKGPRVLIVDDEAQFVEAIVERLTLRGFDARGATRGDRAIAELAEWECDLAILDVKMPGMDGLELIQIIRRDYPDVMVIMLTGHGSSEDAEEGLRRGALRYIMKPVSFEELLAIIEEAYRTRENSSNE